MTGMTLTLKKADLLKELEKKRKDVFKEYYKEDIAELEDFINNVVTTKTLSEELIEWHRDIAEGLENGNYALTATGALAKGAPAKPKVGGSTQKRMKRRSHYYIHSKEDAERQLEYYKEQREHHVKPLDSAIKLLKMSSDTDVTIEAGNYQRLLSL